MNKICPACGRDFTKDPPDDDELYPPLEDYLDELVIKTVYCDEECYDNDNN